MLPRPAPVQLSTTGGTSAPQALPSFANQPQLLPVTVDTPAEIEGGWPKPEAVGLLTGRCTLGAPPQGWRREDIVGAVMKVSLEDWQGGMPLASSRQLGEYQRLDPLPTDAGDATVVYQRDDVDLLVGRPHPATLAVDGQRAQGQAPHLGSLQDDGIVVDRTEQGAGGKTLYRTRKLMRREHHAGNFELCLALNAESLQRLRDSGELVFFTGADDLQYPLALRRATLSVTYGERRATETGAAGDTALMGGLASMAGRWRTPGDFSST
ncbi:MAG: hypothetical protein HY855_06380 [Burkholderiales bacterium]|nr:hypothetical protein [Burkholderiales bacterium]